MRIIKFNEKVGFDDEEMRDRLEVANMKGDLDPNSPNMKTIYHKSNKINSKTEIKKIVFKFPILDRFLTNSKLIEGSRLLSFYATSKVPVGGNEFYCQLSFAFHNNKYYIATILKEYDEENEENWVTHQHSCDNMEDVFTMTDAFIQACEKLGVLDTSDLKSYNQLYN
jgi:hypothetical protein